MATVESAISTPMVTVVFGSTVTRVCDMRTKNASLIVIDSIEITKHMPRARNIAARVAMNGWMRKWWIINPTSSPRHDPVSSTTGIAAAAGQPAAISFAAIIVESATTAPTDRSMPPVRITNVMPTASTTRWELLIRMLASTWPVTKLL